MRVVLPNRFEFRSAKISACVRVLLAGVTAMLFFSAPALAEHTRWWRQTSFEDFEKGTARGVALSSDGKIFLVCKVCSDRALRRRRDGRPISLDELVRDSGLLTVRADHPGRWRGGRRSGERVVQPSSTLLVFDLPDVIGAPPHVVTLAASELIVLKVAIDDHLVPPRLSSDEQ